jgi:hypothetical protein
MRLNFSNMRINLCNSKGSMTVEASIIMPIILITIIVILFIPIFMYKKTIVQSMTIHAAERSYVVWKNIEGDMETGLVKKEDLAGDNLYRRLFDPQRESRIEAVRSFVQSKAEKSVSFPDYKDNNHLEMEVALKDNFFSRRLELAIKNTMESSVSNFLTLFSVEQSFSIDSIYTASIYDPAEFIRNIDFFLDLKKELEEDYSENQDMGDK